MESEYNYLRLCTNNTKIKDLFVDEHARKDLKITPFKSKTWKINLFRLLNIYGISGKNEYKVVWLFEGVKSDTFEYKYKKDQVYSNYLHPRFQVQKDTLYTWFYNSNQIENHDEYVKNLMKKNNKILFEDEEGKVYEYTIKNIRLQWKEPLSIIVKTLKLPKNKKYTLVWKVDEYYSEPLEYEYK